jgi:DNA invertase Pin-like site-specific DNA recombinase
MSERTRAALRAAKARGRVLGGNRGYRPAQSPSATAAAEARRVAAERAAHQLTLEVERLKAEGITGQAAIARARERFPISLRHSRRWRSSWRTRLA